MICVFFCIDRLNIKNFSIGMTYVKFLDVYLACGKL